MGEVSLWQRIWPWLRHPLSMAAGTIAFRYFEDHPDVELRFKPHVAQPQSNLTHGG